MGSWNATEDETCPMNSLELWSVGHAEIFGDPRMTDPPYGALHDGLSKFFGTKVSLPCRYPRV